METTSVSSNGSAETVGRNGLPTSKLDVATLVLIFVVVAFAVVTQLLAASGAISLGTTVQLMMWLVAVGFIILIAIAYMFFRIFERVFESSQAGRGGETEIPWRAAQTLDANGRRDNPIEPRVPAAQERNDVQAGPQYGQDAGSPRNRIDGPRRFIRGLSPDGSALEAEDAWVPPDEFRHLEGSAYSVSTEQVFPDGCYLVPDSITLVSDQPTGPTVYKCRVVDRNPALKDRPHQTVVKLLAGQMPTPPTGVAFELVEFEHLTITPFVTDQDPMLIRYSLRATGLHSAAAPTGREPGNWTVPAQRRVPVEETEAHERTEGATSEAAGTG
jgi:hypothetical protein